MLQALILEKTEDTPEVIFDKVNNVFILNGRSLPENAHEFYQPIINWFSEYVDNPNNCTDFYIFLEYINSSSVKQIFFLLLKLEIILNNGKEVKIIWYYQSDDELMKTKGKEFQKLLKVPFDMVEKKISPSNF